MSFPPSVYKTWVAGETLTAADLNNSFLAPVNSNVTDDINDYSTNAAQMQTTTDPYPASVVSLPTSLSGELERLRYQTLKILQAIKGSATTNWYEAAPAADVLKIGAAALAANLAMGSFKLTGLGAGSAAGESVRFEQLKIIQVVTVQSSTDFTTTSSTFQTSNCTGAITPSSTSNKILVLAMGNIRNQNPSLTQAYASLFRGGTNLSSGSIGPNMVEFATSFAINNNIVLPAHISFLDSPAANTSLTYSVKMASSDNTTIVGWGNGSTTSLILIEVA